MSVELIQKMSKRKKGNGSPPPERDIGRVSAAIAAAHAVYSQFAGPTEDDFLEMQQRGEARKKEANPTPEAFKALTTKLLLHGPCTFIPAKSGKRMLDAFEDVSKTCSEQVRQMALCWKKEKFVVAQGAGVPDHEFATKAAEVLNNYIQAAMEDPSKFTPVFRMSQRMACWMLSIKRTRQRLSNVRPAETTAMQTLSWCRAENRH